MITNQRQYRITQKAIREFETSLETLDRGETDTRPELQPIYRAAFESEIEVLREQLAEYDALREGRLGTLELDSLVQLGEALVKARIAAGMTQRELAEQVGLKEQQIQRYEERRYEQASFARILEIADALGIACQVRINLSVPSVTEA